jgi:hypothetical protein
MEAVRCGAIEAMPSRRFPAPWRADKIPGGYVVRDANGQALVYVYSRENEAEAQRSAARPAGGCPVMLNCFLA